MNESEINKASDQAINLGRARLENPPSKKVIDRLASILQEEDPKLTENEAYYLVGMSVCAAELALLMGNFKIMEQVNMQN